MKAKNYRMFGNTEIKARES